MCLLEPLDLDVQSPAEQCDYWNALEFETSLGQKCKQGSVGLSTCLRQQRERDTERTGNLIVELEELRNRGTEEEPPSKSVDNGNISGSLGIRI